MKVLCVDDHPLQLQNLIQSVQKILPDARINSFRNPKEAADYGVSQGCDILLCEIDLAGGDGVRLAETLQVANPKINIIFVTVCDECERAKEVLRLRPSGYVTKPYTEPQLSAELRQLRHPVTMDPLCAG